ncbi:hypothetical protein AAC387_Pa07g0062 [Persea americana]
MSAKWRALQHRHRYTYSAVVFPPSYLQTLNSLPPHFTSLPFFSDLKDLISLNSVYSQITAVKKVASSFADCDGAALIPAASALYLEILFLDNSLPLHRTLISVLAKKISSRDVIGSCFRSLCEEYGVSGRKGKRFSVSRAVLSLLSYPKLGFFMEYIEDCAVLVALDVGFGLRALVSEIDGGSRPSPSVMEQCQEAMSCLYYLLQRFPSKFVDAKCNESHLVTDDSTVLEIVVRVILSVLKSSAFSRDCLVAAGVSFCAALQARMKPPRLAVFIVEGFFSRPGSNYALCYKSEIEDSDLKVSLHNVDLYSEIVGFSVLSRLCLLRGVLTAVPREVLNMHFFESRVGLDGFDTSALDGDSVWTILFNGILPELCNFCENPIDSHFNFHALTVTQICLQQIKTSLLANLTNLSGNYDPFPEEMASRLLRIIWNNLEDPLNQTVKQVHLIFDLFLDIQSTLHSEVGSERTNSFLKNIASDLLRLGPRCKGRYVPLASLTKRLGAKTVLDMRPNLLFETIEAYVDDDVCCATTSFLKCFLECLRDECWSSDGIDKGYAILRGLCLPPLLHGLVSGLSKLRSNLNTYAIPVFLEVDVDSIFPMLAFVSIGQSGEESEIRHPELAGLNMDLTTDQRVAALVSLLKVARLLALIEGDIDWYDDSSEHKEENNLSKKGSNHLALVSIKGVNVKILVDWLALALTHVDDTLRIDAAETLFVNPKTSSLPSPLELTLMKEAVPLNMRCSSTAFQMKWTSLFRKFFTRVRTALERQIKQGSWQPVACSSSNKNGVDSDTKKEVIQRAEVLFSFTKWLSCFLFFSCYPSAPYERKIMAMELILIMINVWPIVPLPESSSSSVSATSCLYPYARGITLPDSTLSLVGSIVDSWDRLRDSSFHILLHFPTPLPGISSSGAVKEVITWAKRLVCSPRVRESDAGALTLRLIFRKYVLELGWMINASVNTACFIPQSVLINGDSEVHNIRTPAIEYIVSLVDWLCGVVEEGEKDLSEACQNSFVHGILLTLRYTFEELDWNSDVVSLSTSGMRHALEKLLELVMRITSLALWVVSADAWYLPEDMDDMIYHGSFLSDVPVDIELHDSPSEQQVKDSKMLDNVRPAEQVVMVGCWLAMKEVSLLLGTIIRKIPLPSCTSSSLLGPGDLCETSDMNLTTVCDTMLDLKQLETIGNHFLEVLLKMKHNGAIDKTRAGFTALCNRLLCSNDPRLCKMTESWMDQLMERTVAKGQTVDDLLRRSAGIPAAFIAFFLSEPEGTPKKLLPRALRWLIDVAKSLSGRCEVNGENGDLSGKNVKMPNQEHISALATGMDVSERTSKIRDEGVIPTVHAFNVLRAAFNDTNLAADTSGFSAEALIISIRSFSSPYWEVRNSACLAFTALVRRMIGFLNVHKRESVRRALSGLEFFHRYPTLHHFLFNELKIATESLGNGCSQHTELNMLKVVHPSLCPVLILLSRLKPSTISSEAEDALDPFIFMRFISRCATQSNLRVRVLASRALTGLVSNEKLESVIQIIASGLPHGTNHMPTLGATNSDIFVNGVDIVILHGASLNSVHGILLQLLALVDTNCRNLIDVSKKKRILGELIKVLEKCKWIGSIQSCPCPTINSSYLQVLDHMLGIARTCGINRLVVTIRSLLLDLSSQCLDKQVSYRLSFYDPTRVELRRQAAVSYFNCIFAGSAEAVTESFPIGTGITSVPGLSNMHETENSISKFQQKLMLCISDDLYEVRHATLKWLHQCLKLTESGGFDVDVINKWAKTTLQPTMMQLLAVEENPKCTYYILRILFTWNRLRFQKLTHLQSKETVHIGMMDINSIFCFWDKLTSLKKTSTHVKVRETLIRCMGTCVKQFSQLYTTFILLNHPNQRWESSVGYSGPDGLERWIDIYECIDSFVVLIKQNGAASESVNMRKAAAESMVASGLLEQAILISPLVSNNKVPSDESHISNDENKKPHFENPKAINLYAFKILDLWFTCIKLLEDEDVELRQRLARDIQRCLDSVGTDKKSSVVPIQVEKVIELIFEFLSSIFGHWIEYFDFLARWVFEMASSVEVRGDLVRRVFDKEIDNHHEERLLICQICCFHLEKLSLSNSLAVESSKGLNECDVWIFLQKWRMKFLHQLKFFANDYVNTEGEADWIGGIGNHKDAFVWLYANLLGLYALSKCSSDEFYSLTENETQKALLSDLMELRGVIKPFLRNPLISNLYLLVTKSYESMLGVTLTPMDLNFLGDCFGWEGFDPYFLR